MKLKNTHLMIVLAMVVVVFVAIAVAQETESVKSCSDCKAVSSCRSACGQETKAKCGPVLANLPVYLDGPGALLAQAEELELTGEQVTALKVILAEARQKAVALLDDVQMVALGQVPSEPVVIEKKTSKSCGSACGSETKCASRCTDEKRECHKQTAKCGEKRGCGSECGQKVQAKSCGGCKEASSCSSGKACAEEGGCDRVKVQCSSGEDCGETCQRGKQAKSCCGSCKKS